MSCSSISRYISHLSIFQQSGRLLDSASLFTTYIRTYLSHSGLNHIATTEQSETSDTDYYADQPEARRRLADMTKHESKREDDSDGYVVQAIE